MWRFDGIRVGVARCPRSRWGERAALAVVADGGLDAGLGGRRCLVDVLPWRTLEGCGRLKRPPHRSGLPQLRRYVQVGLHPYCEVDKLAAAVVSAFGKVQPQ